MLEASYIRENLEAVRENCHNRGVIGSDPDKVVALDDQRKKMVHETQQIQQRANELSKQIPKEKDPHVKQELIAQGKTLREQVQVLEKQSRVIEEDLYKVIANIPNMTHPDAPVGRDSVANVMVRRWGEPRKFAFKAKDHVELCEALDLVDFEAGARVTGQKFYFLKNEAALLELALVQFCMLKTCQVWIHPGHYTRPCPDGGPRRDRFYPKGPKPGNTTGLHGCGHRPLFGGHRRNHPWWDAQRSNPRRGQTPLKICRFIPLFPHRSRCPGPRYPRALPGSPIHQSGNLCL